MVCRKYGYKKLSSLVKPNQAPVATTVDIGIVRIHLNSQWLTVAIMGNLAKIGNNEITVLVNDVESMKSKHQRTKLKILFNGSTT